MRTFLPLPALLTLALPALAADGVLEINETCAATGCFPGDAANYPVTIDGIAGRSYQLTSDLHVPDENTSGIFVSTPDVTVDLNGFAIIRASCVGQTSDCTPASGTGSGVLATGVGVAVHNGSVVGMGFSGVDLGTQGEIRDVRLRWNRLFGIRTAAGATVSGNTASENGSWGILAGNGSTVSGNTSFMNTGTGIRADSGSTVFGNSSSRNGGTGIQLGSGVNAYGNTAFENTGDGIRVGARSRVADNMCERNEEAGVHTSSFGNRIDGNFVSLNARGIGVENGGNLVVRNSARGNGSDYGFIAPGNRVGEIIGATGVGGTITETASPWANFSH